MGLKVRICKAGAISLVYSSINACYWRGAGRIGHVEC